MTITIINDCKDQNAIGRQTARASALLKAPVFFTGVSSDFSDHGDLEASGNIVDILDAIGKNSGFVLVNVAPRHGHAKRWSNGTPFGYFYYKNVTICSTIGGLTLSLIKKLNLAPTVNVVEVADAISRWSISSTEKRRIIDSQFRSYDFLPRLAAHLSQGEKIPHHPISIKEFPDPPKAVWWVDNFGNCKTTLIANDIGFEPGKIVKTSLGKLTCYSRLKDIPNDKAALIVGSSGLGEKRFLEITVQGGDAAHTFGLSTGSLVLN